MSGFKINYRANILLQMPRKEDSLAITPFKRTRFWSNLRVFAKALVFERPRDFEWTANSRPRAKSLPSEQKQSLRGTFVPYIFLRDYNQNIACTLFSTRKDYYI